MLNKLTYSVTFPNPQRTLSADIDFKEGHTGITGPNGKGKSMILEMIQYSLFGSEALRGKSEDYKNLRASLSFEINGQGYTVERTSSKAVLFSNEGPIASGTKPVNAKILDLFGYSYDVFKVANAANQGQIEELGNMKPAERKRMVDETIGLSVLDGLTEFITAKVRDVNAEVKACESMLHAPVEPVQPEGYEPSGKILVKRNEINIMLQQQAVWLAARNKPLPIQPVQPEMEPDNDLWDQYQKDRVERSRLLTEQNVLRRQLKQIPAPVPVIDNLEEDDYHLESYQAVLDKARELSAGHMAVHHQIMLLKDESPLTAEEIDAEAAKLNKYERWEERQALVKHRVHHQCPACQHAWDDDDPRIKTHYGDLTDEAPEKSKYPKKKLISFANALQTMELKAKLVEQREAIKKQFEALNSEVVVDSVTRILNTRKAYQKSEQERIYAKQRQDLNSQLAVIDTKLVSFPDVEPRINAIFAARTALTEYHGKMREYDKACTNLKIAEAELEKFPPKLDQEAVTVEYRYAAALTYETQQAAYQQAQTAYLNLLEVVEGKRAEAEDWSKGRAAVTDLRAKVKGYLLPSLNAVASNLINAMTGGELSWVVVNDQFEITVEGQRLETLSGAGKAVANLALRIGLGQVLTNRVFSVMLLDEIDASCDDDRAAYIAGCLRNLTKTVKQVIQVSHKQGLEADHIVQL